ncbi:MAG TPA: L-seryl-tRNA(Sec) selenium transferase [Verrucomicrobiota bacterium]|nr:L-seryl-tRNA(Sec) selenium transferase [Verrucomicrobiota bacterium]HRT07019.1 L-seryl-tRNA(Sec) selenium transferase [Candidatus Paceibacterota bacterium]HRT57972.1 L-seryl-tRNA(Sec) selenium transferase [Candidatus Paceibacterota bacterium]
MPADTKQPLLQRIPSLTDLLKRAAIQQWLETHPHTLVTHVLRQAAAELRDRILDGSLADPAAITAEAVERRAGALLADQTRPRIRAAINATGILLHTGLGRAVFPESVVDSIVPALKGYCTLAVHPESGERVERDELVEDLLAELTGAEAATVVNNNAAATLLVLAGLAAQREVIVSRGQLIEIGGSFRLPEVMAQSQARLVEVGATNRTHLADYQRAITAQTAALMRVHPSNYRIVGFAGTPSLAELAALARRHNLLLIDDLGAGALVDLRQFGLPQEPIVRESIAAGADIVLFSGDKLIGGSQAGILVGRRPLIQQLRKHPLMRAMRVDKTCLMVLERTLHLFRHPERLRREHPLYRMICQPLETVRARAVALQAGLAALGSAARVEIADSVAYLGSGSLPTEAIPSVTVGLQARDVGAGELARRLRLDEACVFSRIESDQVKLDMRTVADEQVPAIVQAVRRAIS